MDQDGGYIHPTECSYVRERIEAIFQKERIQGKRVHANVSKWAGAVRAGHGNDSLSSVPTKLRHRRQTSLSGTGQWNRRHMFESCKTRVFPTELLRQKTECKERLSKASPLLRLPEYVKGLVGGPRTLCWPLQHPIPRPMSHPGKENMPPPPYMKNI